MILPKPYSHLHLLFFIILIVFADYFLPISAYPVYIVPIFLLARKNYLKYQYSVPLFVAGSTILQSLNGFIYQPNLVIIIIFRSLIIYLLCFLAFAYADKVDKFRRRFDRLKQLLPMCPDCGALYCFDGQWRSLEHLIDDSTQSIAVTTHTCSHIQVSTSDCPEDQ